jgi:phage tail sheath protein FI
MHIAAANNNSQGKLSPRVKGLPDSISRWSPPIALLDSNGIVAIRWEGPDVFLYGNRMYSSGRTPASKRYTIAERAVYYHVSRDLFVTTRPFIFKSISVSRLSEIQRAIRDKMKAYWQDGWFSDHAGTAFGDQVQIAVPLDLNPPENLMEGRITATVQFRPRPALEDLHIIISPTELTAE